ncbi:nickel pincer cofactor biosynthesis protein LarC [Terriglobus aquaticus]|uniref:Putative nickel insertion protein n=1 Tax=Terriglobus aquaticus TaxID=940139 RepID=A0ABW9KKH1_9BACT|nr:nickel pincer cofactor biosynthesis protein LarC [Terriglobus aquaticus]
MRVAYLDCFAGIAGDMLLGALVDAGVPRSVLEDAADAMNLGASLQFDSVDRSGITAVKVRVLDQGQPAEVPAPSRPEEQRKGEPYSPQAKTQHQHREGHHGFTSTPGANTWDEVAMDAGADLDEGHARSLTDIREIIGRSRLTDDVKHLAMRTFDLLGASEAKIHNVPVDEIHFHEVGAVDAIVDIVASAAGLVHLRADAWHCSPVNVGSGTVRCAHGVFPVPAPATADLLRGVPTYAAHLQKELTTPTGAALLRALSPTYGPQPVMQVQSIGYGAGTRNPPGFANVLRLCVGEASAPAGSERNGFAESALSAAFQEPAQESIAVIETAVDDATPQLLAYVADRALDAGAMDVMLAPVIMKKGRPGTLLTVLARSEDAHRLEQMLLRETTTLGVRTRMDRRVCLDREHVDVQTEFGNVRVKIGRSMGETLNANPEFEDCRRLAEQNGVPLKQVHAAAMAAYLNAHSTKGPKS